MRSYTHAVEITERVRLSSHGGAKARAVAAIMRSCAPRVVPWQRTSALRAATATSTRPRVGVFATGELLGETLGQGAGRIMPHIGGASPTSITSVTSKPKR